MKVKSQLAGIGTRRNQVSVARQRAYWSAIALASMSCGGVAKAQATNGLPVIVIPKGPVPIITQTNISGVVITNQPEPFKPLTNAPAAGQAATTNNPQAVANIPTGTNATRLQETTVRAGLEATRNVVPTDLGTSAYTINASQISTVPGGANAQLNTVLLRAPGVAQDSAVNGDIHVRGEHGNLQYRVNGVFLPEGISGFGIGAIDTRFIDSMRLITGALPAMYGYRTAGVVDITTKSGAFENGGGGELYFGSHATIQPSFEVGGSTSNVNYFISGNYLHTSLGIENPVPTHEAIHDNSDQGKFFSYTSYMLDDTSRLTLMLSSSVNNYQVPNLPSNQGPGPFNTNSTPPAPGLPADFPSANLDEKQIEQNYFGALTYEKSAEDVTLDVSALWRRSNVHFMPDPVGDLFFFGEASDVDRTLNSGGLQADLTYDLNENHKLRGGLLFIGETVQDNSSTTVYDVDSTGQPIGMPRDIVNNSTPYRLFTGLYAQDEWKIFEKLTLNYGARFDVFNSSFDNEHQFSPRANLVYKPFESTTFHAGYARYFTPPPIEFVPGNGITSFRGTTGVTADQIFTDDPVKCERANYFDVGINQQIIKGLTVGVDAYYKHARNELDDGLFGQTLIESAFNYEDGITEGVEFTTSYSKGGFSAYANIAVGTALGTTIDSSQFLFSPAQLNYINAGNYIHLDHLQTVSCSFGASYLWQESKNASFQVFVDSIYGSGLRTDLNSPGVNPFIPNGATLPTYYTLNLGFEQRFKLGKKKELKARLDVMNITDVPYALRNGSGVGVGAPQYGERRSFFGTIGFTF